MSKWVSVLFTCKTYQLCFRRAADTTIRVCAFSIRCGNLKILHDCNVSLIVELYENTYARNACSGRARVTWTSLSLQKWKYMFETLSVTLTAWVQPSEPPEPPRWPPRPRGWCGSRPGTTFWNLGCFGKRSGLGERKGQIRTIHAYPVKFRNSFLKNWINVHKFSYVPGYPITS